MTTYIRQETQITSNTSVQLIEICCGTTFITDLVTQNENESFDDFLNRTNKKVIELINKIKIDETLLNNT